jgi:hypothetical protein
VPWSATVIELLIASPGDVGKARDAIEDAVHAWNANNARQRGAIVLRERDAAPEQGDRAQAIINRQIVDRADVLVGAFWTRLGTPTGAAESGAAEEIDRFVSSNRPAAIYFSRQPVKLDRVDLDQYKRLQEFKERLGTTGCFDQSGCLVVRSRGRGP